MQDDRQVQYVQNTRPLPSMMPTSDPMAWTSMQPTVISKGDPRWPKHLTCWYWCHGGCRFSADECKYSHSYTGKEAEAPLRVEGQPSLAGANADKYRQWFAITRGSPSCDQCPGPVHASGGGEGLGEASEANATAPDLVTDQAETATSAEDHRRYIAAFAAASESGYQKELLIEQENNAALQGIVQRQWSAMDGIYTESVKDTDSLRALCKDLLNVTKALGPKHTPTTPETAKLAEIAQDLMTVVERQRNMRDCLMKAKHSDMKEAGVAHSDMRYNEG